MKTMPIILGAHFSISGGLDKAVYQASKYGCNSLQLFTKSSQSWKEKEVSDKEIQAFEEAKGTTGITQIASHTSYLINPATNDKKKRSMACKALLKEMIRSSMLNIPYVVLHPGAHTGAGVEKGIENIVETITKVFDNSDKITAKLLLEATAGQGTGMGHTFEQIAELLYKTDNSHFTGVCLDTCHIFAAGYDIRTEEAYNKTMNAFNSAIGLDKLDLIHLNDSKKDLGSRVDRHQHIGEGFIGIEAFKLIVNDKRLADIPKILETPKEKDGIDMDAVNIKRLIDLIK
ncbi:MAG: deoxyribonuclease IV [Deltaproteobacteria bacterium]|nr:deoxyribonuclease IV [Deltaproteobacteria bacterium]